MRTLANPASPASSSVVSSKDLVAAYLKDVNAAIKQYGGPYELKAIVVEGVVSAIKPGEYGKIARLEGVKDVTVSVLLNRDDEEKVKVGDKVKFEGRCRGFFEKEKVVDVNGGKLVAK